MSDNSEVKQEVRHFYDRVGWQVVSDGQYQNARYEDLRPLASEYIHRCHLRVRKHLPQKGKYLLDAGSGPIQYPEYLTYSEGYCRRVCADLSIVALQEARARIGEHGLFVVADVSNLPFKADAFDGEVSLHTFHHLPAAEQRKAYLEMKRVLAPGGSAVVVNGWTESPLMRLSQPLVRLMEGIGARVARRRLPEQPPTPENTRQELKPAGKAQAPTGTFIRKIDAQGLRSDLQGEIDFDIFVWRSVSVRFMRALIHRQLGGRLWLKLLFWLEERFPRFFGEKGQYPMVVFCKTQDGQTR